MASTYEKILALCTEGIECADAVLLAFNSDDPGLFEIEYNAANVRRIKQLRVPAAGALEADAGITALLRRVRPYLQAVFSFAHAGMSQSKEEFLDLRRIHVPRIAEILMEIKKFWPIDRNSIFDAESESQAANTDGATGSVRAIDAKLQELMLAHEKLQAQSEIAFKILDEDIIPLRDKYNEAINFYENTKESFKVRLTDLDAVLRTTSKRLLSDNYDDQASMEENSANTLRKLALAIMLAMILIVGFSFFESTRDSLSLTDALLRFGFIMVLSIPAAYLARESAKHRQRQYSLKQTALDVGAIDPYIASLPNDIQNKIKHETASKLFAPKNFDHSQKGTYPINTQEILMKLIDLAGERRDAGTAESPTKQKSEE